MYPEMFLPRQFQSLRILVVDDMEENRDLMEHYFSKTGFSVTFATDGLEAVELCQHKDFDLILMDIQMPGLDGYETTRRIRALPQASSKALIFATTANTFPKDISESLLAGCNLHLAKPLKRDTLMGTIERWFAEGTRPPQA